MRARLPFSPRPASARRDRAMVFASGLLGTIVMSTMVFVLPLVGVKGAAPPVWVVQVFGQMDLTLWLARTFASDAHSAAALAVVLHVAFGFGYAWLYAGQIEPRLTFRPAIAGLWFGAAIWMFAQVVGVPLLGAFADSAGALIGPSPGVLSLGLGPAAAAASLLAHLGYGVTVGFVYGCHFGRTCQPRVEASGGQVR